MSRRVEESAKMESVRLFGEVAKPPPHWCKWPRERSV